MSKVFYYIFIVPLSWLPLSILYVISRFLRFIVFDLIKYRKDVVVNNLKNAYPDKSEKEINLLARKFFVHFSEIFAEGFKGFTISKQELLKRYVVTNPEIVEDLYQQNKSVILVSGHYNNWEYMVQSLNLQFSHQGVGVGQKITSSGFASWMDRARKKFGMVIWNSENVRDYFEQYIKEEKLFTCMLLADQSPSNSDKAYWMRFLNQDTPTLFGPEYFAKKYDLPVIFYKVVRVKRGYYNVVLEPVTYTPLEEPYGEITYKHNKMLEKAIVNPEEWLWSHKRWKHSKHAHKHEVRT